jgi:methionine transaminase
LKKAIITSKLPNQAETIFTKMSVLAQQHNAINLGQGFPDFNMNEALIELAAKAMRDGHNQYAHMQGLLALREKIAEKVFFLYGQNIDPQTEICITPGGTYSIFTALTTILHPGDEVIVFEPAYDSYIPNIEVNSATAVTIPLTFPDYSINWDLVKEKISGKTRAIILNSPHNPTGKILSKNDLEQLQDIVSGTGIFLISDEVYEHVIFDGLQHESLLKYPDLFERSFITFSFGKVYQCTGWKIGYCISPAALMKEFLKIHQFNCFSVYAPAQYALATFLDDKKQYLELGSILQAKRDLFNRLMAKTPLQPVSSKGSYFQLYSYKNISDAPDTAFAEQLTVQAKVASIPVSVFYKNHTDEHVLRFCFVKKEETLEIAVNRLIEFFQQQS